MTEWDKFGEAAPRDVPETRDAFGRCFLLESAAIVRARRSTPISDRTIETNTLCHVWR